MVWLREARLVAQATGGLEQPVWDAQTGTFFLAIHTLDGQTAKGGIAVIDTHKGKLVGMDEVSQCMPAWRQDRTGNCSSDAATTRSVQDSLNICYCSTLAASA